MKTTIILFLTALACQAQISNVNVGAVANDGTGDSRRDAFIKLNNNDNFLQGEVVTINQTLSNSTGWVLNSPKIILHTTNSFTTPYLGTNTICTVSNFADLTYGLAAGQPTIEYSTDGTNWTLSQSVTTNRVTIRVRSTMVPSFGGVPADPLITNVVVWGLGRVSLFGKTNAVYGQSLRVGPPVDIDDAVSWRTVSNLWASTPWMSAQGEMQLNGYGLHMTTTLDQVADTNTIRWRYLGAEMFSVQGAPVALGVISNISIENGTNLVFNIGTNSTGVPVLQFTPSLNPVMWSWVTNFSTSYPYSTNRLWTLKTAMPTNSVGFYRVAYSQAGQSRVWVGGLLALSPRTVTNSTDTTWGNGPGLVCVDSNYLYVAVATNKWKRVSLTTW
jgi:hypothetical protein